MGTFIVPWTPLTIVEWRRLIQREAKFYFQQSFSQIDANRSVFRVDKSTGEQSEWKFCLAIDVDGVTR